MTTHTATEPRLEEYTQSLREDSFVALLRSLGIAGVILLCSSMFLNSRGGWGCRLAAHFWRPTGFPTTYEPMAPTAGQWRSF